MQLNSETITTPPRASATVVLLRDKPEKSGIEVFLLRRHTDSAVLGGAYVFPGGKLDDADTDAHWSAHLDVFPAQLHASLCEPDLSVASAVGLYVTAVREALEECGVLLASSAGQHTDTVQRQAWQKRLHTGESFAAVAQEAMLQIDTQHLAPWSRWITPYRPSVTNKRFDTRFFVAALPPGQSPVHDNLEAIDSLWLTPEDALRRYWDQSISLAPPQILTLVNLIGFKNVESVLHEARSRRPATVLPETYDVEGVRHMCYPGHPRHPVKQRAMKGPLSLSFVDGRFDSEGGLNDLLNPQG
jgi:8-oxo-dGTP pyrophosphatase MutT (NUDIX family)